MRATGLLVALLLQVAGGPPPPGGSISGRVTDKASGQPLPRMVVTLVPADRTNAVETLTDNEGHYQFGNVKPGKYAVAADNDDHHATYLRQWFGNEESAQIFASAPVAAPSVEIASGESRTDVDIALTRALAVAGRVLDPFGEPVPGAEVTVTDPDGRAVAVRPSMSDDLGAYRIFGLRPGRYRACAEAIGNVQPASGAGRAPARTCYPVIPLLSQDANNIDIRTEWSVSRDDTPGGAVNSAAGENTGTMRGLVTDKQTGGPLPHASVHLGFRGSTPRPMTLSAVTGDDGSFTISGLAPGRYDGFATATGHDVASLSDRSGGHDLTVRQREVLLVSAVVPRAFAINVRIVDAFDAPASAVDVALGSSDIGGAIRPLNLSDDLGHVRVFGLRPGRYVICAEPKDVGALPPAPHREQRDRLLRTCYPSTATEAESLPITIANADIEDLGIRLVRGRAFSISGTILDASGAPAGAIAEFSKYIPGGQTSTGFEVRPDGHFEITNVQPGAYAIEATTDRETAFVPLSIEGDDIENLVVAMRRTTNVAGRVAADDPATALPGASGRAPLELTARLADDRLPGHGSSRDATANSDGTFTLEDLFGSRRIDVQNIPTGWYVKAIRYGTKDVTDQPIEFKDNGGTLDVILSSRGATVTGTVADVIDKRVARAMVFLVRLPATDKEVPRVAGFDISTTGNYNFAPIRDGNYSIVAVPADTKFPMPWEWDRIAALAALGERVTVADLDQRTIELHVTNVSKN
jgi:protocatechuate 3,4-dioxygenase beta subunit